MPILQVQEAYRLIGDSEGGLSEFTTQIQAHVSREFNVDPKIGIELIRSAVSLFPDDAEIKSIPHYVRHNRCFEGNLRAGFLLLLLLQSQPVLQVTPRPTAASSLWMGPRPLSGDF